MSEKHFKTLFFSKLNFPFFLEIEVSYCAGKCVSLTKYKSDYPYFEMDCKCCKASKMTIQAVQMKCGAVTQVKVVNDVGLCECRPCVDDEELILNKN